MIRYYLSWLVFFGCVGCVLVGCAARISAEKLDASSEVYSKSAPKCQVYESLLEE